jgi:ribose/xylose/arabinose/galactoside ABC-type transport system permease subunit
MRREWSVAFAIAALAMVLAAAAPRYFSPGNLRDLFLVNLPILVVAMGATLVILAGEIDISIGSAFAVCSVVAGIAAKAGLPMAAAGVCACVAGASIGALNGALVAYGRIPSIVVTLAAMVAWRDGLRWTTGGAWIEDLPPAFQWLGVSQQAFPVVAGAGVLLLIGVVAWTMRHVAAGRAVYATGSNTEAARLASIDTAFVKLSVFTIGGALTGLGALLNSVRFNQIPSNTGLGLEMKVIAAVVVGGAAITGGRGTFTGTVLGVVLLGAIGPALTFLGVSAQWERALQGAIILAAVAIDALRAHRRAHSFGTIAAGV